MQPGPQRPIEIVLHSRIAPAAIPVLCELVHDLILKSHETAGVTCDVSALGTPDEIALDALMRLQLTARRLGTSIHLRNARGDLVDLLAVAGLSDVLPLVAGLGLEADGQPEEREQALVDEEVDGGDASA